jgi:hypothetical protein
MSLGSAFVIDGTVVTNLHVIRGAAKATAKPIGSADAAFVDGVLASSADLDIARLSVPGLALPSLQLVETSSVDVGTRVYAVGNPEGLEGTFSEGIVSGQRVVGKSHRFIQITAPISPGSSGGPVLDDRGRVVGVATATFLQGQNLNFAVPADAVREVLAQRGPTQPIGRVSAKPSIATGQLTQSVEIDSFLWKTGGEGILEIDRTVNGQRIHINPDGEFTVSIRNKLDRAIRNVSAVIVFVDDHERPVDTARIFEPGPIDAKLARRTKGDVSASVKALTTSREVHYGVAGDFERAPRPGRVVARVLDFQFAP